MRYTSLKVVSVQGCRRWSVGAHQMNASSRVKQQITARVVRVPDSPPRRGRWIRAELFEEGTVLLVLVADRQNLYLG